MRNVISVLTVFVLMVAVQLSATVPEVNAGTSIPPVVDHDTAVVVCQFKPNGGTYNVVLADVVSECVFEEDDDDDDEFSLVPPACEVGMSCTGCLQTLHSSDFEIETSDPVTNNRVTYVLRASGEHAYCDL